MLIIKEPGSTGVDFVNQLSPTAELNILTYLYYYNGAGVAVADYNNDGLDDLYFTCNQCADELYLNRGNWQFDKVTDQAGINNGDGWTTGVTHVDINGDGLEDIYVSKVGNYRSIAGKNILYINQGVNQNGIPQFEDQSESFGLDIMAFATASSFFDYDLDGDLDLFLLCHSVHPNRTYGNGISRLTSDSLAGDRLLENIDGRYIDVSRSAGIYQGRIGYGLGLSVADINDDGYPDVYVGNDFFENDYLYINNRNKSFTDVITSDHRKVGHTTHYSMGNTLTDLNNDAKLDLVSLDMLPEDIQTLKSSGSEDPYSIYERYLRNNYAPQYMQNTLHLNRSLGIMSEVGYQTGIAATEWSWGVLGIDLDLDGHRDLFISNGILGATNDMDYVSFIVQDDIQESIESGDQAMLSVTQKIPQKHLSNYVYKNLGAANFQDVTKEWMGHIPSFSNGSAFSDLDKDGDLDLIINNVNEPAMIIQNRSRESMANGFIKISLVGEKPNTNGIGAKIWCYVGASVQLEQHYPVKSYLSSSTNTIVFGLGNATTIDSLIVRWSSGKVQKLYQLPIAQKLTLNEANAVELDFETNDKAKFLQNSPSPIVFKHHDETTLDFDYDPLVPFALSNEGPDIAVQDVNSDGLDDLVITGAKHQSSILLLQNLEGTFDQVILDEDKSNWMNEDIAAHFFDADMDGDEDLVIVSAGNEYSAGEPLKPRLYLNQNGIFERSTKAFDDFSIHASTVNSLDIDGDGDLDLVLGSIGITRQFGHSGKSTIQINNGQGKFLKAPDAFNDPFEEYGNFTSIQIADLDNNGFDDLICVGDWMPVSIFYNNGEELKAEVIPDTEGWWNVIKFVDYDLDGDLDLVAGNWGLNTRLRANSKEPIRLYSYDFDNNEQKETIITYYYKGTETLLASKDELTRQLPSIKKKYLSYQEFAKASLYEILDPDKLGKAMKKEVKLLTSTLFINNGDQSFTLRDLPFGAQSSTVNDIMVDDINGDDLPDLLLVGNNYELSTQIGRLDASHGVLLINDGKGFFTEETKQTYDIAGAARDIEKIRIGNTVYFIVAINNDQPVFIEKIYTHE